ncbi:MAG: VOC family protein [Pseudomonadota bacterium]
MQLELSAGNPAALATFYAKTFCLDTIADDGGVQCTAQQRKLRIVPGEAGQLRRAVYQFHTPAQFKAQREALTLRSLDMLSMSPESFSVRDPDGRLITFMDAAQPAFLPGTAPGHLEARLQHFGVRTPAVQALVDFYVNELGFILSDRVLDKQGDLTAAFIRTDSEHHSMAIFRGPVARFDHFSCEAADWNHLRDWADHMAAVGVELAWGIGRHGPGNDTFLMVRDTDGNMGEISSDMEMCASDRETGIWPHQARTLNQWGTAIMRS